MPAGYEKTFLINNEAPFPTPRAAVTAGIGIAGPPPRFGKDKQDDLVPHILKATGAISAQLVYTEKPEPEAKPGKRTKQTTDKR